MSEEWMKAAVWGLVTLALLIVLWSSWRAYRAEQLRLQKLQDFRERYDVEMTQLYRWFASDECALMVLDWLDLQLVGGDLRPDGSRRLEVAIHGLQAVRQAVRDSHFNDRCRGAADASCAMSVVVAASSQPRVTPEQMAELRNAYLELEGVDLDVFMALCLNQLLEGRTVKVITERREYLNPQPKMMPFDRFSEPVLRRIVNDLGEQVWPCAEDAFTVEAAAKDGEQFPRHVQVIYEVVEPTVDEKVDEVLRLMRLFENAWDKSPKTIGREEQQAVRAAQRTMRQAQQVGQEPVAGGVCVTSCRSEEGITVGLVDTIINSARLLSNRNLGGAAAEALRDMRSDSDVCGLFTSAPQPAPAQDVAGLASSDPVAKAEFETRLRKEFESRWPKPKGVTWGAGINDYCVSEFAEGIALSYPDMWMAYKAGAMRTNQ